MLKEKKFWQTAGKISLVGSLIVAGLQPVIVNAAQSIQLASTTQTANTQKSVAIFVDGKQLKDVNAIFKDSEVWIPILAFSKATGMEINYKKENGAKQWEMVYKPNKVTDELKRFYLNIEDNDIYLMTEKGSFFEGLIIVKGIVYAPVKLLNDLTEYDNLYKKENQTLYINSRGKSQDQSVQQLIRTYLKNYEDLDNINLKLYHPEYFSWIPKNKEKYPSFLNHVLPGKYGNPFDSQVSVDSIALHKLRYNGSASKAILEFEYRIFNNTSVIHSDVNTKIWLGKLNGNWTIRLMVNEYTFQINKDTLQKQANLEKAQPELVSQIKEDAKHYYNAWNNSDINAIRYWTDKSSQLEDNEGLYSEDEYEEDTGEGIVDDKYKSELLEVKVVDVTDNEALVIGTENKRDYARHNGGEKVIQKKLSKFKKMSDGRWGYIKEITFIDEPMTEVTGYEPAWRENESLL